MTAELQKLHCCRHNLLQTQVLKVDISTETYMNETSPPQPRSLCSFIPILDTNYFKLTIKTIKQFKKNYAFAHEVLPQTVTQLTLQTHEATIKSSSFKNVKIEIRQSPIRLG